MEDLEKKAEASKKVQEKAESRQYWENEQKIAAEKMKAEKEAREEAERVQKAKAEAEEAKRRQDQADSQDTQEQPTKRSSENQKVTPLMQRN